VQLSEDGTRAHHGASHWKCSLQVRCRPKNFPVCDGRRPQRGHPCPMNRSFVLSLGLALGVWAVAPAAFSEEKTSPAPATESAPKPETTTPAPEFTIKLDYSTVPECEAFALKAKELCEEWYPKLNELLFGPDQPLPRKEITL